MCAYACVWLGMEPSRTFQAQAHAPPLSHTPGPQSTLKIIQWFPLSSTGPLFSLVCQGLQAIRQTQRSGWSEMTPTLLP